MIERIEVDEKQVVRLVAALRAEEDGKGLNQDLVEELTHIVQPAIRASQAAIMSMPSSTEQTPGLRSSVASHIHERVRLSGQHPSVGIAVDKSGMPRSFRNAPKRLNARRGWRHKVFGGDVWVTQRGKPGWFDDTIAKFKPAAERAAARALDKVAARIDHKTKG
jgi:hypothetical protein